MGQLLDLIKLYRPKPTVWKGEPFRWIEEKLDGHRVTIIKDGHVTAIGRKERIDLWPKLGQQDALREELERLPDQSVLDGEVVCDGNATEVKTAMNDGTFRFIPFAVPVLAGRDMCDAKYPLGLWREAICFSNVTLGNGFTLPDYVQREPEELIPFLQREAVLRDIEGFVLKLLHWRGWYKVKPVKTCDLIVTRIKEHVHGEKMGALEGSLYDGTAICWVGGGWSDEQRVALFEDTPFGRVMEVMYDKVDGQGGLRFPRFVRWRDDKPAEECDHV